MVGGTRFPDVVAQTNYEIDIHSPDGKQTTDERKINGSNSIKDISIDKLHSVLEHQGVQFIV